MKSILDYRMLILDKNAEIIKYPKSMLMMHQDCLDDFAKVKGYLSSNRDYLVKEGVGIFYNVDNGMFVSFLPNKLSNDQLYSLDYLENFLDEVSYMEVLKGSNEDKVEFIFDDNIKECFSSEVIQSYYNVRKKR